MHDRPTDVSRYERWEGARAPTARDLERFELDTLASRRAPARPSFLSRLLRRPRSSR